MKFFISLFLWIVLAGLFFNPFANAQNRSYKLTNDGTWGWFSDPRAIYLEENSAVLTGYVMADGSVATMLYNPFTGFVQQSLLGSKTEANDQNNPVFIKTSGNSVLAFYSKHHAPDLLMHKASVKNGIISWRFADTINPNGKASVERYGDNKYTYANPFILSAENNRIYLFGQWVGAKPTITWSDDGGNTWAESRVVVEQKPFSLSQCPYVKYFSDGKDKIHMVFTDGNPKDEKYNSVYYAYYSKGSFYKAGGELICTIDQLPFEPKEATLVYKAEKTSGRAWIYDIVADSAGNPAIAYARYPTINEHIYYYAWFNGKEWVDTEIVNSGGWFPKTPDGVKEREPYYSGGMTIDPFDKNCIYISRKVSTVFEIEKWVYNSASGGWSHYPVTAGSKNDQIRPFVVKNFPSEKGTLLLWITVDRYLHYTDYLTGVRLSLVE